MFNRPYGAVLPKSYRDVARVTPDGKVCRHEPGCNIQLDSVIKERHPQQLVELAAAAGDCSVAIADKWISRMPVFVKFLIKFSRKRLTNLGRDVLW